MATIHQRMLVRYFAQQMLGRYIQAPVIPNYEKVVVPKTYQSWEEIVSSLFDEGTEEWIPLYLHRYQDSGSKMIACAFRHISSLYDSGGHLLSICDSDYPEALRHSANPPLALNAIGPADRFAKFKCCAVVGARKASPFALKRSYEIGRFLADSGFLVVSGGAIGCDIAAHLGCLSSCRSPVPAVVVFAGGLSSYYPKHNLSVFRELGDEGAVFLSERLWDQPARPYDFPIRNRIVAGISEAAYVMQAGIKSGAMITANNALNFGRDVYVLIHDPSDVRADGSHKLMLDGALGFENSQNLLEKSYVGYRVIEG